MLIRFAVPSHLDELIDAPQAATQVSPDVDVMENDNETVIVAELPGVAKEDVSVTFEGDVLSFGGERKRSQLPENVRVLLNEQKIRSYRRSLRIRHDVDRAAISATLEQGLLRIVLPKVAAVKPRVIEVR